MEAAILEGCTVDAVTRTRTNGQPYISLEFKSKEGAQIAIVNPQLDERLTPNTVGNYQRRLKITTRFSAAPSLNEAATSDTAVREAVSRDGTKLNDSESQK